MLSDEDEAILELEERRYLRPGRKVEAIRQELGLTELRYYQRLNALLDVPEAEALHPQLVHRLRRLRDKRQRGRPNPAR